MTALMTLVFIADTDADVRHSTKAIEPRTRELLVMLAIDSNLIILKDTIFVKRENLKVVHRETSINLNLILSASASAS